jgi:hypothetical protein
MAYTINLTNGNVFATITDGTYNQSSSVTLVGKNYAGYGEFLDENFIQLLENFANSTAPTAPLIGQIWWDSINKLLKVYNGTTFKTVGFVSASAAQPTSTVTGELWYDTTNQQVKVYTGSSFIVVGPAYSSSQGTTGAIPETINDTSATPHYVTTLYSNNTRVAIFSGDADFTAAAPVSTLFPTVYKGVTFSNATGTNMAGNLVSSGNLVITTGGTARAVFTTTGANITGYTTVTSTLTAGNVLTAGVVSATGNITGANFIGNVIPPAGSNISTTGNVIAGNVVTLGTTGILSVNSITHTGSNAVGNIGSSGSYFNQVFATATTALYADVAERFAADEVLDAGTVVELGGSAEITKSLTELSENVFGVISTRAAYLMNGGAGENDTHPPVAMTGRVPVKVTGIVHKGQRLVSAGAGIARAARAGEATSFNVIGRSLVDKLTPESGTIEAIVTIKN